MIDQIMANFDRLVVLNGFKPVERQLTQYRQTMIGRLQSSSISRRVKLISFKLYEAIATGQDWRYQDIFATWVKQFEQELCATWSDSVVPQTLQTRLTEALEISYLKAILLSNENAYPFLRFMAPTFLHTVFSDPTLWPPNHQGTSIPLAHVISSARCEMGNFVVMDTLYSMAYSLPQFVDYDTSIPSLSHELYGYSWAPGCPTELLVALAEINQCREGQPTTTGRGWKEIEFSLLTWQPQPSPQLAEWESWMIVAWLAVQESWKHTLLVYVYLALCGAASDDPRIEYSIKQLLRIVDTVKKPSGATAGLHLFAQYFIAGVCARTESQRALVKEKLINMSESRKWLVHGNIFVPVLQHLWTGAGAGGRPVRWADYVRSREQVLPVSGASASA
ncbi:hypothetical protein BN14_03706 [Rhizoctonia solani AG-1 IB]|uniref:Fungal zn(2)-cys(6) binuclear cluster domain protein n=1 Tax=Thanatephorus cucumeris (strain AG1-IB / isolate 7/3/14) TaxID=1108050 RepID=M5BPM3_THACB|nr:hypothetical protein BN14_03706 [Rhizoctonia solani AG-1 IB]